MSITGRLMSRISEKRVVYLFSDLKHALVLPHYLYPMMHLGREVKFLCRAIVKMGNLSMSITGMFYGSISLLRPSNIFSDPYLVLYKATAKTSMSIT